MPLRRPLAALALLVLAVLACGLPGPSVPPAPGGAAPTETLSIPLEPTPEPLPPSDFVAVLDAQVAAGEIRYEDGLIRLLRAFLGDPEVALPSAYDEVLTGEGNTVIDRAFEYLATGTDPSAQEEIRRLLVLLFPSHEQLEAYSQPAGASVRGPGLARPLGQMDCARRWLAGFPLHEFETYPCFAYAYEAVPGVATYGVYFPAEWLGDASRLPWFERAREAAHLSLATLGELGEFDNVDIVFSTVPGAQATYIGTTHDYELGGRETCPIIIYPLALTLEPDDFRQSIAHELFHCFQSHNLRGPSRAPGATWWIEGTATYFSNVVYPTVNFEHDWVTVFDAYSGRRPLYKMSYESFGFWQFLGSRWGDRDLISWLATLPTRGDTETQRDHLASTGGMAELFHQFGQAYLESRVADTGGGNIPFFPDLGQARVLDEGPFHVDVQALPFVLARRELWFEEDLRFDVVRQISDGGRDSANVNAIPGAWAPLPSIINTACGNTNYLLLVTNTLPSGQPNVALEVEGAGTRQDEEVDCDRCLIGTWTLDNSSYLTHMGREWTILNAGPALFGLSNEGAEAHPTEVFGDLLLNFRDDGVVTGEQYDWGIAGEVTLEGRTVDASMTYNGAGEATWRIQTNPDTREPHLFFDGGTFDILAEMTFLGFAQAPRPTGGSNDPIFLSSPQSFTCTESTLTYNGGGPGPIIFHRTSSDPP